ncbi:TrbI/VirB10 family protein [Hyphomonas sp.]|uniref:TrbI/VirB10 family protein n=1 Tax=Hyphomonas sp. TaxID=87 RepID=UPI003F71F7F2
MQFETELTEAGDQQSADSDAAAVARALQARESGLFFTVSERRAAEGLAARSPNYQNPVSSDPYALLASLGTSASGFEQHPDQNGQSQKAEFVETGSDRSIYNPHQLETPASPWQVMAGTVIPATLLTGVNSDLPGQVIAQVTEPIYDTVTGNTVLIPQGSRVMGRYDSVIAYGQSRALIVWSRIILPDGSSIRIENLPAVDGRGMAGLSDRVDHHGLRLFSAAALSSLISVAAELSEDDDEAVARALRDATQEGASRAGDQIIRRQLSVQPTLTIRPGWRLRILVHQDIILKPYGDH